MPGYDQTGPVGSGPMTGRKSGRCTGNNVADDARPYGRGGGRRRMGRRNSNGIGRGWSNIDNVPKSENNMMLDQIEQLKGQVNSLKEELAKHKETH